MEEGGRLSPGCDDPAAQLSAGSSGDNNNSNNQAGRDYGQLSHSASTSQSDRPEDDQSKINMRGSSSFDRLPPNVIELILYAVDANVFASLALLNRKWRHISDSPSLYAHHLFRCQSFLMSGQAIKDATGVEDFASLKHKFLVEIRRNAFSSFLRPRRTLIKLMSASMSSSTASPLGEAFRFSFSANGHMLLCLSSSRIFVLDIASEPVTVKHELKTWRRPLGATALDDGSLLVVVSSRHQANVYSLSNQEAKHIQVLMLNDAPRALALSPTGGVLAMAYDDSIEVYTLGKGVLAPRKRTVPCVAVDSISFSSDGTKVFGSSVDSHHNHVVTITAPFYTESETDLTLQDLQVRMWTTQVLFPNIMSGYSHACLIPHAEGEGDWSMAYDRQLRMFKAVRVSDADTGTTYFMGPPSNDGHQEDIPPVTMPTIDHKGELAAVGFQDGGLWLYGLPEHLDYKPSTHPTHESCELSSDKQTDDLPSSQSPLMPESDPTLLRVVIDRQKVMLSGHRMADVSGITAACWVRPADSLQGGGFKGHRLAAVAPGGLRPPTLGEENIPFDSGRVLLLDFDRSTSDGETREVNIELGEREPFMLREHNPSMDTAVHLERTRARLIRRGFYSHENLDQRPSRPSVRHSMNSPPKSIRNSSYVAGSSEDVDTSLLPLLDDTPYDNTQPQPSTTLRRAIIAAALSRRQYNRRHQRPALQIPYESDADNWVPPPPPYTREPEAPLPEYLRRSLLPRNAEPIRNSDITTVRYNQPRDTQLNGIAQVARSQSIIQGNDTNTASRSTSVRRTLGEFGSLHGNQIQGHIPENYSQPFFNNHELQGETRLEINSPGSPSSPGVLHPASQAVPHNQTASFLPPRPVIDSQTDQDERPTQTYGASVAFSVSSPDLHLTGPNQLSQDVRQETIGHSTPMQERIEPQSQYQDPQHLLPGRAVFRRRVSTDPTPSALPQNSNQEWRRRIEEWNEQTIRERSRRSRLKCIVM